MACLPCQGIPLDFSHHALAMASKGYCENVSASGVRSIPGALTGSHDVARGLRASDRLRVDKRTRLKAAEIS